MGTAEILIVFSALMALIALVTIGIDWIGKPLKTRRFIPKIYRFDDEKLPVDAYGNTTFDAGFITPELPPRQRRTPVSRSAQAAPRQVAQVHSAPAAFTQTAAVTPAAAAFAAAAAPGPAASSAVAGYPDHSGTAFSDSLAPAASAQRDLIAGTGPAPAVTAATSWEPGMALDTPVDDRKPSLATKAERFWITTARSFSTSHFDDDDLARMAAGKAPRRINPRTSKAEAMQLTGLRRASAHTDVRMRWPDDAVDPWNAS